MGLHREGKQEGNIGRNSWEN